MNLFPKLAIEREKYLDGPSRNDSGLPHSLTSPLDFSSAIDNEAMRTSNALPAIKKTHMNLLETMLKKESKSKFVVVQKNMNSPVLKYEKFTGEEKQDVKK